MSNLKKLRAVMAGLLCAGLLFVGIGVGVGFGEFSKFTYAGHTTLDGMVPRTYSEQLPLEEGETLHISPRHEFYGYWGAYPEEPNEGVQIKTDISIPNGQVKVDVEYRSVYSGIQVSRYYIGNGTTNLDRQLNIYTSPYYASPLAIIMAYKDQALEDIRQHKLGDYDEVLVDQVVITINPADADRVVLED